MRDGVRMIVVLALIAMISGATLAAVYQATSPTIQANKREELRKAIFEVVPGTSRFEQLSMSAEQAASEAGSAGGSGTTSGGSTGGATVLEVYQAEDGSGQPTGLAIVAEGPGFQGLIRMMIGLDPLSREVTGVKVLEHTETPGLGARITEDWFQGQFTGKALDDPFQAKNDVDAITGATISTRAVSEIIKSATNEVVDRYEASRFQAVAATAEVSE